jgi:hypothetical protein
MLDGKKVIINVDKLLSNHNSVKFREFINANRDTVFTASLYGKYTQMYILDEDVSSPKWMFFEDDLIEVE